MGTRSVTYEDYAIMFQVIRPVKHNIKVGREYKTECYKAIDQQQAESYGKWTALQRGGHRFVRAWKL